MSQITYFKYDQLPAGLRSVSATRPITWKPEKGNAGLLKILTPLRGNDELRPVMMGINYDNRGICVTNAHVLLFIPADIPEKDRGIFSATGVAIDGRYPYYWEVIPKKNPYKVTIDLLKFESYVNASHQYSKEDVHQSLFSYNNGETLVGFNARLMGEIIKTLRMLGMDHADLHFSEPNRAMVFTPVGKTVNESITALIMPVMIQGWQWVEDEYETVGLGSVYEVKSNNIRNIDGTSTEIVVQEGWQPSGNVTRPILSVIRKLAGRNKNLITTNYAIVEKGVLKATDLETFYQFSDCGLPDGFYVPVTEGLVPTVFGENDFSKFPIMPPRQLEAQVQMPLVDLAERLSIAEVIKDNDDLRPQTNQHHISVKDGVFTFEVTDSKLVYRDTAKVPNVPDFSALPINVNVQKLFAHITDTGTVDIRIKGKEISQYVEYAHGPHLLQCSTVDEKYPNVLAAVKSIQTTTDVAIILNKKELDDLCAAIKSDTGFISVKKDHSGGALMHGVKDSMATVGRLMPLRIATMKQPHDRLILAMPTYSEMPKEYYHLSMGTHLLNSLKKLYVGRTNTEFTLFQPTEVEGLKAYIVYNPTIPNWPENHVLGAAVQPTVVVKTVDMPRAKAPKPVKQVEMVPTPTPDLTRARAYAYAQAQRLRLLALQY